ncbi:MAG: response regulator [Bacteroidota bacterium]|jgi:CheY-like chemotaxis protein|nr:response regulator [Bacteroidota bacterium]
MDKHGPIIIIEDNAADQRILTEIFKNLEFENELCFFNDGLVALDFLNTTTKVPFLIISDINMPRMTGFELRQKIHENAELSLKCVPFLFFSTGSDKNSVEDAYAMSVQGFFRKPEGIDKLEATLRKIVEYWKECVAPSDFNNQ